MTTPGEAARAVEIAQELENLKLRVRTLEQALREAIRIAGEARREWDAAPEGMRAGKLLVALSGGLAGYREDIEAIHKALAG